MVAAAAIVVPDKLAFEAVSRLGSVPDRFQRRALCGHCGQRRIVLPDESHSSVGRQPVVKLPFGGLHPLFVSEAFEVCLADVGDDAVIGFCDTTQGGYFARGAGPHFDDTEFDAGGHGQQRQRDADVIVQVALCGIYPVFLRQDGMYELFRGGLAVGTGDGEYGDTQPRAVHGCQLLQRLEYVIDKEIIPAGIRP